MTNIFNFYLATNTWWLLGVLHEKVIFKKLKWIFEYIFGDIHLSWNLFLFFFWVGKFFNIMCTWIFLELSVTKLFLFGNNVIEKNYNMTFT